MKFAFQWSFGRARRLNDVAHRPQQKSAHERRPVSAVLTSKVCVRCLDFWRRDNSPRRHEGTKEAAENPLCLGVFVVTSASAGIQRCIVVCTMAVRLVAAPPRWGFPNPVARDLPDRILGTMLAANASPSLWTRWRCPYRPVILIASTVALLSLFWFASRYPQLLKKAEHVGQHVASMAFGSELLHVDAAMPWWQRIAFSAVNWLDSMKI